MDQGSTLLIPTYGYSLISGEASVLREVGYWQEGIDFRKDFSPAPLTEGGATE